MHFAQPPDPFFHRMHVVADRAPVAHFTPASFLCRCRQDTVFVDIQSKIEFFFHWCVCLFSVVKTATLRNITVPAVGAALLHLKKASSPRENMNGKHTAFFNAALARSRRARSH